VPVLPIVYAPGFSGEAPDEAELVTSQRKLVSTIATSSDTQLSEEVVLETRSILEGAKALMRPARRTIDDPKTQKLAVALSKLEEEIASFDQKQRQVALTVIGGPQRIRGLAGSGKTIILAMKAALAHIENPNSRILITFYTRSLRDQLTRLITRFFRHFAEGEPDWRRVHVRHGWGRKDLPGVYREACVRSDISPLN
jgi:superfamily I DNA and RNA helicase